MNKPKDTVYQVWQQHFTDYETARKALNSQCKILKRLNKKYPEVVFVMGLSSHGEKAKKVNLNKGKPGRPKVASYYEKASVRVTFLQMPIYISSLQAITLLHLAQSLWMC